MDGSADRFARGCAQAGVGFATAATAAYTDMAVRVLDFWSVALSGLAPNEESEQPAPQAQVAASEPMFGMALADWHPFSWMDTRRYEALSRVDVTSNPVEAFMAFAGLAPLRGSPASWGVARLMIDSGVPRAVAWPAAEASAAALDAADAASKGFRQVLANYHTESGHATTMGPIAPSALAGLVMMGLASHMPPGLPAWTSFTC
jgi:hypothetical protein